MVSTSGMTSTAKIGIGRMSSSAVRRTVTLHDDFVMYWTRTKKRQPSGRLSETKNAKRYEKANRVGSIL